ncbi:hypothetical protein [Adhaeribacter radiodurans]|uniref:Lipoprotein n=1 Tax=Adhaeribacter radiodurans TaxID=2745197 RepID=A0A7L7L1F9_9BACT|nr:hypothetical protein [Adhaeribacter radiodurans]QMU26611.1 hypothetical protein HUW48_00645 [Adhaeribacter radiodurans]
MKLKKTQKAMLYSLKLFSGLGLLTLLIMFMSCNNNKKENKDEDVADMMSVKENNSTVSAYVSFIQADTSQMSLDHAFTNEALSELMAATTAMAGEIGFDVKGDMDKVKEYANNITKNPYETSHADDIRKAADILSTVLYNMQQAKYADLANEAGEVKSAATAINPDVLTLDQKDAVKSFFDKSADLLQKMN